MDATDALEELELLGSDQWGLVTAGQARRLGVDRATLARLAKRGTLLRLRHGLYALPSARAELQGLRGAWLATEPEKTVAERRGEPNPVVVRGQSAAVVHGLGVFVPAVHHFASERRRQTRQPDVALEVRAYPSEAVVDVAGLPVTSVQQTMADLAADRSDFDHLARAAGDAMDLPHVTHSALRAALAAHAEGYGYETGTEFLNALLTEAGWTPPEPDFEGDQRLRDLVHSAVGDELRKTLRPVLELQSILKLTTAKSTLPPEVLAELTKYRGVFHKVNQTLQEVRFAPELKKTLAAMAVTNRPAFRQIRGVGGSLHRDGGAADSLNSLEQQRRNPALADSDSQAEE